MRRALAVAATLLLAGAAALGAQVPPAPPPPAPTITPTAPSRADSQAIADSILIARRPRGDSVRPRPPISPSQAFLRSLLIPGWGQASLNRNVTGGVFVTFEGIAVTMVWKSQWQLRYARVRDKYVKSHTQERQDWITLLVFNHLMAAAEAYVSAHLYDFPVGLQMQTLPDGATGVGLRARF